MKNPDSTPSSMPSPFPKPSSHVVSFANLLKMVVIKTKTFGALAVGTGYAKTPTSIHRHGKNKTENGYCNDSMAGIHSSLTTL